MNSAFHSTAILVSPSGWGAVSAPAGERLLQAAGGTFAALALGLAVASGLAPAPDRPVAWFAVACAAAGWALLRSATKASSRRVTEEGFIDVPSGLYNRKGMAHVGEALLEQCRREGRPMGVVVLDFADLPEVTEIYGRETARKVQAHVVRRMRKLAGTRGIAARTGRTEFTVLLPGASSDKVHTIVQRVLGKPSRIEFDAGDSEVVLVPDMQCDSAGMDVDSVDELYLELAHDLRRQQAFEQRRQVWLTRQRERHSRPMSLPPSEL